MAISRKEFNELNQGGAVITFLRKNRNKAYTRDEIAKGVKMDKEAVSSSLRYLKTKRKILHKKPWWIAK